MTDDQLWSMSDEDIEKAFQEAKANLDSPITDIDNGQEEYEDTVDDVEDDMEQPGTDSDDDTTTDEEVDEVTEEDSETEDSELDGDTAEEDEQTAKVGDEADAEVKTVDKRKFKANGLEYEFTDDEILKQFPKVFGQAMDYTRKTQQLKPWRKTIDAIENANLSHDDINLAIDILKGDKDAIATMLKRTGVDTLDIDVENSKYVPRDYGRNDTELAIKDIVDTIKTDREFTITENVLSSKWDDASRKEFAKDPSMIKALHVDIQSGMFNKVEPIAAKLKVYDGGSKSDLDYYMDAARILQQEEAQAYNAERAREQVRLDREAEAAKKAELVRVKTAQTKQAEIKQASTKRKAAAPTASNAGTKKSSIDYLDDSDEGFDEWYKAMQARH